VLIYPNPASEQLTVDSRQLATGDQGFTKIELFNLLGYKIQVINLKENGIKEVRMDVSDYPDGIYFVVIGLSEGTILTRKLIIN